MEGFTSSASQSTTRVLLVEEDPESRNLHADVLRLAGFSVTEVSHIADPRLLPTVEIVLVETAQFLMATFSRGCTVVAIADEVRDGMRACVHGALDWVPRSADADYLVSAVRAVAPAAAKRMAWRTRVR